MNGKLLIMVGIPQDHNLFLTLSIWVIGLVACVVIWVALAKKNPTISDLMKKIRYIEIFGFYLTLIGLLLAFNSDVILNSQDLNTTFKRIFDKENVIDFSRFYEHNETQIPSHVVIVLDVSGSMKGSSRSNDPGMKELYSILFQKIRGRALLFSQENINEVERVLNEIESVPTIQNSYKLRALNFVFYLDSISRYLPEEERVDLTIIKFGGATHKKTVNKNYLSAVSYILDVESGMKPNSSLCQSTDFAGLFEDIPDKIFINTELKNRLIRPQYVFTFFTDFVDDVKSNNQLYKRKKIIEEKLANFNKYSNYSTFYFFPNDTVVNSSLNTKTNFSVIPILKSVCEDDWLNLESVTNLGMIDFGVYRTNKYVPFYYTKPFVEEEDCNVKLTLNKYKKMNDFTISFKYSENKPLRDQYFFYTESCRDKMLISRRVSCFRGCNLMPLNLQFQGYVNNQLPSRFLDIRDVSAGKRYELEAIFIKDFDGWVIYVFLNITFVFFLMFFLKLFLWW